MKIVNTIKRMVILNRVIAGGCVVHHELCSSRSTSDDRLDKIDELLYDLHIKRFALIKELDDWANEDTLRRSQVNLACRYLNVDWKKL